MSNTIVFLQVKVVLKVKRLRSLYTSNVNVTSKVSTEAILRCRLI